MGRRKVGEARRRDGPDPEDAAASRIELHPDFPARRIERVQRIGAASSRRPTDRIQSH
jgi:hypothetical protein